MRKSIKYGGLFFVSLSLFWVGYQILSSETQAFLKLYSPPEYMKLDKSKPLQEQVRIFEMAGREFHIPIMYINGSPKPQKHQDSMLLQVIWPDMKAVPELSSEDEYKKVVREERRWGQILLEPASLRPDITFQVSNLRKYLTREDYIAKIYGLDSYTWYDGEKNSPRILARVYLDQDIQGHINGIIQCRGEIPAFRICEHKFTDKGIIYQIDYNEGRFIKEWRNQKKNAISFLNSLEIISQGHKGE